MSEAVFYGKTEDEILQMIEGGRSVASISAELGLNRSILSRWLRADKQRSARTREARELAADAYDDQAEAEIQGASDPFELAKAKEIAHHLRWRASKISPYRYGDKQQVEHSGQISVSDVLRDARGRMTPEQDQS